jgi:bifunctional non-homologous end joining protein LigD
VLEQYRKKRDFKKTSEPRGKKSRSSDSSKSSLRFVIQKHAARRLHYDFRLELDGVLISWAVPKGLPLDPSEKHLAVRTEDHPLEYGTFEGVIPAPGYGAGEVIIWDQGTYEPIGHGEQQKSSRIEAEKLVRQSLKDGKITFFLNGEKLTGEWALVRLKKKETDWLLIKHKDSFANASPIEKSTEQSVVSGLTLDDIKKGIRKPKPIQSSSTSKKAGKGIKKPFPKFTPPMLAMLADSAFNEEGWFFEPKLDGIRAVAYIHNGSAELYSRTGLRLTHQYPNLVKELKSFGQDLVLDGEIVAFDDKGHISFQQLQARSGLTRVADINAADKKIPIIYYVFDILYCGDKDLRGLPLIERKTILNEIIKASDQIRLVYNLGEDGAVAYQACIENNLEGIVGKDSNGKYESGRRSRSWLKVKRTHTDEFLICGWTEGTGARRSTFGSLILGEHDSRDRLRFVGNVGTGFDANKLKMLLVALQPLVSRRCPFESRPGGLAKPTWVRPELVAEIKFAERTKDGILRTPVFLHLRQDIEPEAVRPKPVFHVGKSLETTKKSGKKTKTPETPDYRSQDEQPGTAALHSGIASILSSLDNTRETLTLDVGGENIKLTNLNKEFWPSFQRQAAITKRDYIIYLARIAPFILPHLRDRLITLVRFPNGIEGQKFYQKHWDEHLPKFVETLRAYTEHEKKDQNFLLCNNLATLIWLGQIADLELHTSHTRSSAEPDAGDLPKTFTGSLKHIESSLLNYPDFIVFDLDPYLYSGKEAKGDEPELHHRGFALTCKVALHLREVLKKLSLKAFVKTSGKTGLHIYVPIVRNVAYEQVRQFSQSIGRALLESHPDLVTMDWSVAKRSGKIFFDHNMNARSKSLASIYSPRVIAQASVSTPVTWDELNDIYPADFTIQTLPSRLKKVGDLWSDILSQKNDLQSLAASTKARSKK